MGTVPTLKEEDREYGYGVDTHNRFFPLRDREGPTEYGPPVFENSNRDFDHVRPGPSREYSNGSTERNYQQQNLDFPRPNQGVKRPVENKEEPEWGGEHSQKKLKK